VSVLDDVREQGFDALTEEDWQQLDQVAERRDDKFGEQLRRVVDAYDRSEIGDE